MKLGQLLSLESADLLPPELAGALAVLRASADAMPAAQVRRVLGREYGRGREARFARSESEPIAAASIGNVHSKVSDDGRSLALEVQYPGVARSIDADVGIVAALLRLARLRPVDLDVSGLVAEAKRQLRQQTDYLAEAASLRRYRALVTDEPALSVPAVHDDFTTRRVLPSIGDKCCVLVQKSGSGAYGNSRGGAAPGQDLVGVGADPGGAAEPRLERERDVRFSVSAAASSGCRWAARTGADPVASTPIRPGWRPSPAGWSGARRAACGGRAQNCSGASASTPAEPATTLEHRPDACDSTWSAK